MTTKVDQIVNPSKGIRPRNAPNRHILFYGQSFSSGTVNYTFSVLCGDQAPTITGGYAKWQVIDRPLRRGITLFQGYDPVTMQLQIRFMQFGATGSWLQTTAAGALVEQDILGLSWMAGADATSGPSAQVYVSSYDGNGNTVPLIPFDYQSSATENVLFTSAVDSTLTWVITGLDWDQSPIRNEAGYRVRQDATVTLQAYTSATGTLRINDPRPKATTFVSRNGADTPLTIARAQPTTDAPELARKIKDASQNKALHLRSIHSKIKHGKKVYIPAGI